MLLFDLVFFELSIDRDKWLMDRGSYRCGNIMAVGGKIFVPRERRFSRIENEEASAHRSIAVFPVSLLPFFASVFDLRAWVAIDDAT